MQRNLYDTYNNAALGRILHITNQAERINILRYEKNPFKHFGTLRSGIG